ncbi:MAG: hypothetical protein FWE06_05015 [Oscillospiraceae bacterium]|nr:hypothetical protein [Oscillospiraceae bacterium]
MSRRKSKTLLLQVILPIILGILIYALLRTRPPFGQYLPWRTPAFSLAFLPRFLRVFIIYRLSNMLWTFAFVAALNLKIKKATTSAFIVMTVIIVFEYCQYVGILSGTSGVTDIFYALLAVLIYTMFFGKKR